MPNALSHGLQWVRSRQIGGRRWLEWTPRGDSLDPVWLRLRTWQVVGRTLLDRRLWPWGRGRGQYGRDARKAITAYGLKIQPDHVFCEPLEVVYEHGIFGVLGVVAFVVGVGLSLGVDPRRAEFCSLVVWAVTMTGSVTLRTWPFPLVGALLLIAAVWP
jgi:hypothetical protein